MDNRIIKVLPQFQVIPSFSGAIAPHSTMSNICVNNFIPHDQTGRIFHAKHWHIGKLMTVVERISNKYLFKRLQATSVTGL